MPLLEHQVRVLHLAQEQPVGEDRLFLGQHDVLTEDRREFIQGHLPTSHFHKEEHTEPDHPPEKAIAGDGESHPPGCLVGKDGATADPAQGVLVQVRLLAQRLAVGGGQDEGSGLAHAIDIQGQVLIEIAVADEEGILFPVDEIVVGTGDGIIPGVLILPDLDHVKHGNVIGKVLVQAVFQVKGGWLLQVDMQDILAGMHPGIGTSAPVGDNGSFQELGEGLLHHFLDGLAGIVLLLPAAVVSSVESEVDEIAHVGAAVLSVDTLQDQTRLTSEFNESLCYWSGAALDMNEIRARREL